MKKLNPWFGGLTILVVTLLLNGPSAHADFSVLYTVPEVYQLEAQFESQLTTRDETYGQPRATSYYDDLVDHYEQDQLMRDVIAQGIN